MTYDFTKATNEVLHLPDLRQAVRYTPRCNVYTQAVAPVSAKWFIDVANLSEDQQRKALGFKTGLLSGRCYPSCNPRKLRVSTDFLHFLFWIDDWTDDYDPTHNQAVADVVMNTLHHPKTYSSDHILCKIIKSFWIRMLETVGPRTADRFMENMNSYLRSATWQSTDRERDTIPTLEEYIPYRRDTTACRATFAFIEYCGGFELPDEVAEHPIIRKLEDYSNDTTAFANDILSFNKERAKGDDHNMVAVAMHNLHLNLPDAVQYVARMVHEAVGNFEETRSKLPSWGAEIDCLVTKYVEGLQDWMIGNVCWSFESERYFGKEAALVGKTLCIELLPRPQVA